MSQDPVSVVDIANRRIRSFLESGSEKYGLKPVDKDQAERIAALSVALMMVDGLWLTREGSDMKMEFPLRPDVTVTLAFKGSVTQADVDLLTSILVLLKPTLPNEVRIGPDGFSRDWAATSTNESGKTDDRAEVSGAFKVQRSPDFPA